MQTPTGACDGKRSHIIVQRQTHPEITGRQKRRAKPRIKGKALTPSCREGPRGLLRWKPLPPSRRPPRNQRAEKGHEPATGVGSKRCNGLIYKVVTSLYGRIDNEMATVYFQPIALKYRCELAGVAIIEIVQCCTTRSMSISYTQKIGKPYSTVHFSRKLSRRTTSSSYRSSVGKRRLARLLMNWLPKPLP